MYKFAAEMAQQGSSNPVLHPLCSHRTSRTQNPVGTQYICSELGQRNPHAAHSLDHH